MGRWLETGTRKTGWDEWKIRFDIGFWWLGEWRRGLIAKDHFGSLGWGRKSRYEGHKRYRAKEWWECWGWWSTWCDRPGRCYRGRRGGECGWCTVVLNVARRQWFGRVVDHFDILVQCVVQRNLCGQTKESTMLTSDRKKFARENSGPGQGFGVKPTIGIDEVARRQQLASDRSKSN